MPFIILSLKIPVRIAFPFFVRGNSVAEKVLYEKFLIQLRHMRMAHFATLALISPTIGTLFLPLNHFSMQLTVIHILNVHESCVSRRNRIHSRHCDAERNNRSSNLLLFIITFGITYCIRIFPKCSACAEVERDA